MSEPFLGEIQMIGFNFAPRGWAFCDGQILPINQNQSLYSLLGTTYGGDGRTSFALPDLRSRTPLHRGDGNTLGRKSGVETVTLTAAEMAAHTHTVKGEDKVGDTSDPTNHVVAEAPAPGGGPITIYHTYDVATRVAMHTGTITNAGGGQPHDNMQPFLTINFIIALRGLFPSRN